MPSDIHLVEAVLGVDVPLCEEQVVDAVRIDLWDAQIITHDLHGTLKAGNRDLSIELREGSVHRPRPEGDQDDREDQHDDRRDPEDLAQSAHARQATPALRTARRTVTIP